MESGIFLTLWTDIGPISLLLWLTLLLGVLYLAREQVHALVQTTSRLLARQLRHLSRHSSAAGALVRRRNLGYLLALAREQGKRSLDREFHRLTLGVERELATFPSLSRRLNEQITRVEQDYQDSVCLPPRPPEWLEAVATLTHGPGRNDPAVQRILEDLNNTLDRAAHQALLEYRATQRRRHRLLARLRSYWRMVEHRLGSLEATIAELNRRARRVDRAMLRFEHQPAEPTVKKLANAAGARFLFALALLAASVPVAIVAFQLIARPIAEITAGTDAVAGIAFYHVAAAAMLITEITAGALALECLGITRLLPTVAALEQQRRNQLRVAAVGIFLITVLAAAALAWTRDYLVNQDIAFVELFHAGRGSFPGPEFHWIPAMTHSALALSLGCLLGSVAIPLESALQSGRVVLGAGLALGFSVAGALCNLAAVFCFETGRMLIRIYDLIIFVPLRLESVWQHVRDSRMMDDVTYFRRSRGKFQKAIAKRHPPQ